jgi:hypothetical protein
MRVWTIVLAGILGGAALAAQMPAVQNGRVQARAATSLDRDLAAVGGGADAVWVGWREPLVDGQRNLCSTWSDGQQYARGTTLEPRTDDSTPQFSPSSGPIQLEAGATLVVLARVVSGHPERVMSTTADCPLDAGNRAFFWLTDVPVAESLRYLESLTKTPADTGVRPRLADSAISAIGLHRDPAADAVLDRLVASGQDAANRRQAATALASSRGAHGFQMLSGLAKTETDPALRRSFASSLGQTREPGTIDALLALARDDRDADVRADAVYRYAQRAGVRGLDNVKSVLTKDGNENVRRRAVAGIATMASDTSVPQLIDLARQGQDAAVRKDAVSALGRSTDARAKAYLEEIVRQ